LAADKRGKGGFSEVASKSRVWKCLIDWFVDDFWARSREEEEVDGEFKEDEEKLMKFRI
jgi:hypothetical protein